MDRAGPGDPAEALEGRRDHQHAVMRLSARPRPGMPGMARAVVDDPQQGWRQCLRQQNFHSLGACQGRVGLHGIHIGFFRLSAKPEVANTGHRAHNESMTRRTPRPRAYAPDPAAPGRCCDMPGCGAAGEYRAPKSRQTLTDYWWFCLEHVRAYNGSWDFYKGMSPAEVEQQLRADTSWQRPSWPLGRLGTGAWEQEVLRDPLHILAAGQLNQPRRGARQQMPSELREPLATLGLSWPTTLETVKSRYKELAKQHHPDANGGSRDAEERLKTINLAYAALRSRLGAEPRLASAG
jgi:hypothetical protein